MINWAVIQPGDTITIYPGTYTAAGGGNSLVIASVNGTSTKKSPSTPRLAQDLYSLTESTLPSRNYVVVSGLEVTRNAATQHYAAAVVQGTSSDIKLSNLKVRDAFIGVAFSETGLRNRIESSEIYNSKNHGVTAATIGDANNLSYISGNNVHDNGGHGIDIEASFWRIEGNTVSKNGSAYGGTSGIHLFSSVDSSTPDCDSNQIYYNYVSEQRDSSLADGNGIQIDHFCDSNKVAFNVLWSNAGAGISLYVGKNNTIVANTSYKNATDLNRLQYSGVYRGEIVLASDTTVCTNSSTSGACLGTALVPAGRSGGNVVYDNIVVSSQAGVQGINGTPDYVNTARHTNYIFPNLYYNTSGGASLRWGTNTYFTALDIDNVTGLTANGGGNLVESPYFLNASTPAKGSDGLRLTKKPTKEGWRISPTTPDMLGAAPITGGSCLGAYYAQ